MSLDYFLRVPTDPPRYFQIVIDDETSPPSQTITELAESPSEMFDTKTPPHTPTTEAPYERLLSYYTKLPTSQYQGSTNFLAFLTVPLTMLDNAEYMVNQMYQLFDIDDGVNYFVSQVGQLLMEDGGVLLLESGEFIDGGYIYPDGTMSPVLDIIGLIVGLPRIVNFIPTGGVSPILDDETYRLALKAKIAANHWDGRIGSLQEIWRSLFFGGTIGIIDNQDMTMAISTTGTFTSIIQDLIDNGYIVPIPQAVGFNIETPDHPLFGFDRDDEWVSGLSDEGSPLNGGYWR